MRALDFISDPTAEPRLLIYDIVARPSEDRVPHVVHLGTPQPEVELRLMLGQGRGHR